MRRAAVCPKIRKIPAGFEKVLIARGAFLAVPALLVHQNDGRQQAEPLHSEGDVRQIGNRAVPILEIECIQELLGTLGADLS